MSAELRRFLDAGWGVLEAALADRSHPARVIQLATVAQGLPRLRSLVLRDVHRGEARWDCHTDLRSAKVAELAACAQAAVLAWDPRSRLQFRGEGEASVLRDAASCDAAWAALTPTARQLYRVAAQPGSVAPAAGADVAPGDGRAHFAVLRVRLQRIDLLLLGSDAHRRAEFRADQDWRGRWIQP